METITADASFRCGRRVGDGRAEAETTMNCGMKDEMLLAWVDGDLDQAGRARVAEHIVGCVDCHRTIGDLKDVTGALEKWTIPEPSSLPTARELLDREGVPPSAAPGAGGWMSLVRRYGAVAGIALFATVAGLVILPRYTSPDRSALNTPVPGESKATSTGQNDSASRQSGEQAPAGTVTNEAAAPPAGTATAPGFPTGSASARAPVICARWSLHPVCTGEPGTGRRCPLRAR